MELQDGLHQYEWQQQVAAVGRISTNAPIPLERERQEGFTSL